MPYPAQALRDSERTVLDVAIRDEGWDVERCLAVGIAICDALEDAHARGRICRDLAPANIVLLGEPGSIDGIDLELALEPDDARDRPVAHDPIGSPGYISPERACGLAGDARSDLYALGCILFELVAGRLPFVATTVPDLVLMHVMVSPPRLKCAPASVSELVDRLLRKEPAHRFQTSAELRSALVAARAPKSKPGSRRVHNLAVWPISFRL